MDKMAVMMGVAKTLSLNSTCARRAVGCVLLNKEGHILSTGYNGVPRGFQHCTENSCSGVGYASGQGLDVCQAIHAEQNALMQCRNMLDINAVFVTTSPCMHCMKMLLNTPARVIWYETVYDEDALRLWRASPNVDCLGLRTAVQIDAARW